MVRFSVVIPAYNEQDYLPALLNSVDEARDAYTGERDATEVVVANNQSTDETESIARDRGCRVVTVIKRSNAASRNGGASIAMGEVLPSLGRT